jgi:CheY-like chemotaxis protein
MTVGEQIEALLDKTIAALPRLKPDELEELERQVTAMAEMHGTECIEATRELRSKLDQLQIFLAMTAKNLKVLQRVLSREATKSWVA